MRDALTSALTMWRVAWRAHPLKMSIALALMVLSGLSWPVFAAVLRYGTDAVVAHDVRGATVAAIAMAAVAMGAILFDHFAYVPYAEATELAVVSLESGLIELANGSAPLERLEQPEFADKLSLVQKEISGFSFAMIGLMESVSLTVSMLVTGILLASVNPLLLLLALAALPPVVAAQWAQKVVDRAKETAARPERQALHLFQLSTTAGAGMELRVSRLQQEIRRRHAAHWAQAGRVQWRAEWLGAGINAAGQLTFAVAYLGAVLLVVRQSVAGSANVGDVFLVIVLAAQVNQQVNAGLEQLRRLQRMAAGLTRLRWLQAGGDTPQAPHTQAPHTQAPPARDVVVPDRVRRAIELRDVNFTYPGSHRRVLDDVNLVLPAGSLIALIGENGAGKTTLVKLLCSLYKCSGGEIRVDGVSLLRFPEDAWRARVTAAFQDYVRFETTARQTVGVGDIDRVDDERAVRDALARAGTDDIIDRLPDGLSTHLGKTYREGTELSGGQWQKLALGRAMMRDAPLLLILDEPTSALDAQAEHEIFERYAQAAHRAGERTGTITLLVSHRFSTVRMAELIVVLDDGRVVETGDHETLMARGGLYAELYTLQASAYEHRT